jgi:hypothetical protein
MWQLPVLSHLNLISGLIPLGAGFYLWKHSEFSMRLLTGLVLFGILIDIAVRALALRNHNNMALFHIYTLIAYGFVALMFSYWHTGRPSRLIRLSILLFYSSYAFLLGLGYENLMLPNKYSLSLMSVLISIISLYTLYSTLRSHADYSVYGDERFWVSLGAFFTYASNAFVFSGIPVYITHAIWQIHNVLVILGNMLYFIGFLCLRK